MKTTIHNPNDPQTQKPVDYPCVMMRQGAAILAHSPQDGVFLAGDLAGVTVAPYRPEKPTFLSLGWLPIREPLTITFHPNT